MSAAAQLSPLDVACGIAFESRPPRRPPPLPPPGPSAAAALERAVLPALRRPPCLVSFSGGGDSSLVLAAATRAARRAGLAPPVPATIRLPDAPLAGESLWQEQVVAHLGLTDWVKLELHDELDVVGPYATRLLRDHGLLWPCNVHFHLPLVDAARGGSLLTGLGGDELFGSAERTRLAAVAARDVRPQPRDLAWLGLSLAPRSLRAQVLAPRRAVHFPWLRPPARRAAAAAAARQEAAEPRDLAGRMAYARCLRYLRVAVDSLACAARGEDVQIGHPLLADELWSAVRAAAAPRGWSRRSHATRALFGGWLPDALYDRRDKASFDAAFRHDHSRAFVTRWDGRGVPDELVDAATLRDYWCSAAPASQSLTLLQAAWLQTDLDDRLGERQPATPYLR